MSAKTWFHTFWHVYFSSLRFLNVITEFSQNYFFNISNQKLKSDHNSVFSMLLRKSVYHMIIISYRHKKMFDLTVFFSQMLIMFLIYWMKIKTFWIQNLLSEIILSFSIFSFKSKYSIFSDLNCLLNSVLDSAKIIKNSVLDWFYVSCCSDWIFILIRTCWIAFSTAIMNCEFWMLKSCSSFISLMSSCDFSLHQLR